MSQRQRSPESPSGFLAETRLLPRKELHPNPWNVNRLNAFQYTKLLESIQEYGFLDPILARPCAEHMDYEIVGGEHRWRAAGDLNLPVLPVIVRQMTDPIARKISLIDNELHGQADPMELSALLKDLDVELGSDLLLGLPFTDDILKGFIDLPPLPQSPSRVAPGDSPSPAAGGEGDPWVERTYRMPASVAGVIDDAIAKAKDGEAVEDWQALERVAADFLAS